MDLEFSPCEDYEPGDDYRPMQSDPLCAHCGGPKRQHVDNDEPDWVYGGWK